MSKVVRRPGWAEWVCLSVHPKRIAFPLILNLLKDVIPSVAEESKMPAIDFISRFLDSSAALGMTW